MTTKLVLRILGADGALLGWAEVAGHARGDGALWVEESVVVPVEAKGVPTFCSTHWCDVNVETRVTLGSYDAVEPGMTMGLPGPWKAITVGPQASGLAAVTVRRPVQVELLPGSLGVKVH